MRSLSFSEITENMYGMVNTKTMENGICIYRFSDKHLDFYSQWETPKTESRTSAGMIFDIITDTEYFEMNCECLRESKSMCFFDIYVDNVLVCHYGESGIGDVNISLKLNSGKKQITVYFPTFYMTKICNIKINKNASIYNVKKGVKALFLGDSITQGYTAEFPSLTYVNRLARELNLEILNQGISGETYNEMHIDEDLDFNSDMIFCAYGTNDWDSNSDIKTKSEKFFYKLNKVYPKKRIYVLLPIWRKPNDKKEHNISFEEARQIIKSAALQYDMIVIDTMNFVPHYEEFFSDKCLHPNELGFELFSKYLYEFLIKGEK